MLLGTRRIAVGDNRRITVDYSGFLPQGVTLNGKTVALVLTTPNGSSPTSTVGAVSYDPTQSQIYFNVTAGVLNELFTANVQVTDTNGEIVNDTINFIVAAPGA